MASFWKPTPQFADISNFTYSSLRRHQPMRYIDGDGVEGHLECRCGYYPNPHDGSKSSWVDLNQHIRAQDELVVHMWWSKDEL